MKSLLFVLLCSTVLAQTPAQSNVRGSDYPQLYSDGRAAFRITAAQAKSVAVELMVQPFLHSR